MGDFGIGLLAQGRRKPDLRQPQQQDPISPIEKFFGGRGDPLLSAEANQQAADDALLAAGLQMLLASNPTAGAAGNIANIVAQGALAGQGVGAQSRQAAMARQAQAQVGQLLTSGQLQSRQDLENAMLQLAAAGAMDEAKLVLDILKNRGEPEPSQLVQVEVDGKLRFARSGPDGFKLLRGQGREIPAGLEAGEPVEVVDEFGRPTVAFQLGERNLEKITGPAGQTQFVDPDEGRVISEFAGEPRGVQTPGERQNLINQISDDFRQDSALAQELAASLARGRRAGNNAVGDQTRIIVLNKMLDPGSVVRQSEFARVGEAGGFEGRAQFFFNQLTEQGRLPDFLREQIDQEIENLAAVQARTFRRQTIPRFEQRARQAGIDPSLVVFDPFEAVSDVTGRPIGGNPEGGNVVGQGDDPFRDLGQ